MAVNNIRAEPSPREGGTARKNKIGKKMVPNLEPASSEVKTFLPKANDGSAILRCDKKEACY